MVTSHTKIQTAKTNPGLIDEIIARHPIEPIRDDDVTWQRLAARTGWTRWRCERIIKQEIEAGHLVKVTVLDRQGHEVTAHREPVDTES